MEPEVILISQLELPYEGIGSWTSMYGKYFQSQEKKIDYLLCPEPKNRFHEVNYVIVQNRTLVNRVKAKILKNSYVAYLVALDKILQPNKKYIIQIIDNFGIVNQIHQLISTKYRRPNFYIQFFYHGFKPFYGNLFGRSFYDKLDEMVLLTRDSYKEHLDYNTILPCRFSILHNGIDKERFCPLPKQQKLDLKEKLNVSYKTVFVWCSQDRPKKGLHLILEVWKRVVKDYEDIHLWVIGAKREITIKNVSFLGKVPNKEIHKYFQASSVYLFPTLCHEGFGLSLLEALSCGNLCIASSIGGVPEVLDYGNYGILVDSPNMIQDWEFIIRKVLKESVNTSKALPKDKYSIDTWIENLNNLIESAKISLSSF